MDLGRCLVTGYSGFIGNHIVAALQENGLPVRGLTRQATPEQTGVELFQGDLTQPETLAGITQGVDTIIHAAGHAHVSHSVPELHNQTTLEGTRHLLHEAEKNRVQRFIFISSIKAMPAPGAGCMDETENGLPTDEYGLARRNAEALVLETGRRTGMHVSVLRPTLVYGPGCKGNLASLLRWIDKGIFPPLPDTGNRRSMIDVRDLVRASLLAAEMPSANGETCIISDDEDYSTQRIVTAMRSALGKPLPAWSLPVWLLKALAKAGDGIETILGRPALYNSGMCSRLLDSACYHSVRVESALGFRPAYCLEDTLPDMVAAHRNKTPACN